LSRGAPDFALRLPRRRRTLRARQLPQALPCGDGRRDAAGFFPLGGGFAAGASAAIVAGGRESAMTGRASRMIAAGSRILPAGPLAASGDAASGCLVITCSRLGLTS